MTGKDDWADGQALRRRAEEIARERAAQASETLEAQSPVQTRQVLHELRVHQIELEMQNEELRRAQAELDAVRARYFDLYDLAPVGYCTLSEHGLILEANLTAATLLGVARGSQEPPRLIVLTYRGRRGGPHLGLVGKGVTFDSGGISIKPAENMEAMKGDMAGAAAVIAAICAVARLGLPIRVTAVVPATENLPSGTALKPGDILRAMSGKTIEVINTDAEGRLILADALAFARTRQVTHLVDAATLTGACVVALERRKLLEQGPLIGFDSNPSFILLCLTPLIRS